MLEKNNHKVAEKAALQQRSTLNRSAAEQNGSFEFSFPENGTRASAAAKLEAPE